MFDRTLLFATIVGLAVGGPYAMFHADWNGLGGSGEAASGPAVDGSPGYLPGASTAATPMLPTAAPNPAARLEGPAGLSFEHLFRFDLSPLWVTTNWQRVTTALPELDLEGMRVPVVTGTRPDDISGSLSYYFDKQQRLQRISFQGSTGDAQRLAAFLSHYHQLQAEPNLGAGLYIARWNGSPKSVLRVRHFPVVNASVPQMRFQVDLELNRPDANYRLSTEMEQLMNFEERAGRW